MFPKPEVMLVTHFMNDFYEKNDVENTLARWWREDKRFFHKNTIWYAIINLREPYMYIMALLCRLYGERNCSRFTYTWVPLAYIVNTT
jgi:hypothetical protein